MSDKKINVLIVDDSAVIRAIIRSTLEPHDDIAVAGVAVNGEEAVQAVASLKPDIVILDIEMPVMDGITALPLILKEKPDAIVLICSTLSARGADISMKALELGAAECMLKPGGETITNAQEFQTGLVRTVRALGHGTGRGAGPEATPAPPVLKQVSAGAMPPRILAIGSSTGGPKALLEVLKDLKGLPVPIVMTQHMPKTFTALLAQNIQQTCGFPCAEGADGMVLRPGCAYLAPGGFHMLFRQVGADTAIRLNDGPQENYCRPAVDPMLRSLAQIYGGRIQAAILTGMGSDGLEGCRQIVGLGGQVIAQDEATSVVWGMPGAVAAAGLCSAVLPLPDIAAALRQAITKQRAA